MGFRETAVRAYNRRMFTRPESNYSYWLLNAAAFVTFFAVVLGTITSLTDARDRSIVLVGVIPFAILLVFFLRLEERPLWMHGYMLLQSAIVMILILMVPEAANNLQTLFFILSAQSMLFLPIVPAALWLVALSILTVGGYWLVVGTTNLFSMFSSIGGYLFFGTFGAALRQANASRQESQRLLVELKEANAQLVAYNQQVQQLAVAEERNRLAREMHDALGHRLTVAVVQLEGAQRLIPTDPERAAGIVGTMRAQLKTALAELRQTVSTLRQPGEAQMPEALAQESLATAVTHLAHTFQEATNLPVHVSLPAALPQLTAERRLALYRAAQESLTNVQRHAGAAQAWLDVAVANGRIVLTVADDGQGFVGEVGDGRFGLQGLRERAARLQGTLELTPSAHGGAQVRFDLPIDERMAGTDE